MVGRGNEQGAGLSFSRGSEQEQGAGAAGHLQWWGGLRVALGGPGGLMCFPLPMGVGGCVEPKKANSAV